MCRVDLVEQSELRGGSFSHNTQLQSPPWGAESAGCQWGGSGGTSGGGPAPRSARPLAPSPAS